MLLQKNLPRRAESRTHEKEEKKSAAVKVKVIAARFPLPPVAVAVLLAPGGRVEYLARGFMCHSNEH